MEFGSFKSLLGLLFFGSVIGFALWELVSVRRARRKETSDD